MDDFLKNLYKYLNLSINFFDAWLKKHPIRNHTITPIEMKILFGVYFEGLTTQQDIEKYYGMYRSTIGKALETLQNLDWLTVQKISRKNHPISLSSEGIKTIEYIFTEMKVGYKAMIKQMIPNADDDKILHEYLIITQQAYLKLEQFAKYLPIHKPQPKKKQ